MVIRSDGSRIIPVIGQRSTVDKCFKIVSCSNICPDFVETTATTHMEPDIEQVFVSI